MIILLLSISTFLLNLWCSPPGIDTEGYDPVNLPQYSGWCVFAPGNNGEKVKVDPETYVITSRKLYLFYNFWANDTSKPWKPSEMELIRKADISWNKIIRKRNNF